MPPKKKPVTVASYYTKPGPKKKVKKRIVQNYNRKTGDKQRIGETRNAGKLLASYRWGITRAAYTKRVTQAKAAAVQKAKKKREKAAAKTAKAIAVADRRRTAAQAAQQRKLSNSSWISDLLRGRVLLPRQNHLLWQSTY